MPSWQEFQPFIIAGLALGGVYAISGVGLVVLYRATGVLNLAFGAIGALGALVSWQLVHSALLPTWVACTVGVLVCGLVTYAYGRPFGAALAQRGALVKAVATLGLSLALLGVMEMIWSPSGGAARTLDLPTSSYTVHVGGVDVTFTQIICFVLGLAITGVTAVALQRTDVGVAMRAMANDREITATLGVPVRRVEGVAWFGCGLLSGVAGLLLADLIALNATTLTFFVIAALVPVLIARLRSMTVTLVAAIVVGLVNATMTPLPSVSAYRDLAPFVLAGLALLVLNSRTSITDAGERLR